MKIEQEEPQRPLSMHPKKFALWLFLVTIVMIFASLTSAYIVRRADGGWLEFDLPNIFWVNTVIILASSASMQWALFAAKKDEFAKLKVAMLLTTALGIAFLIGQFFAWGKLVEMNVYFGGSTSNPAGSFLYVLTGLHGLHLVAGIIFILVVLFSAFNLKVHSKKLTSIEMCTTFWHFLDGLWIYLFLFLLMNH